jgi:enoyl-[acyl-carrier protein] reductase III
MIDLRGKIALVTGASRGIGRASTLRLAEAGADVIVNYVSSRADAISVAREILALGRQAWVVKADVSEEQDVESLFEFINEELGQLDILVSNAATGGFRPLLESTGRHFTNALTINSIALVHLAKAAMPLLEQSKGRGKIVTLSSHGSDLAIPMYAAVGASKAALESIVRHPALEVGNRNVNVNVVKAGLVPTDSTRRFPNADDVFAARRHQSMTGDRLLEADDVANVVLFLCSPLSDLIQGETITVDGGSAVHV